MRTPWLLVSIVCLLAGLFAGVTVQSMLSIDGGSGSVVIAGESGGDSLDQMTPEEMRIELQMLRTQNEALIADGGGQSRVSADFTQEPTEDSNGDEVLDLPIEDVEALDPDVAVMMPLLLAELDTVFQLGLVHERFKDDPYDLGWFLMSTYLESNRPDEAMALMTRLAEMEMFDPSMAQNIAMMYDDSLDPGGATAAWERALGLNPGDQQSALRLAELDPSLALSTLQSALAEQEAPGETSTRMRLAEVLEVSGRDDEARAILDQLYSEGNFDWSTWDLMAKLDPEAAEERLREQIAATGDSDLTERLAGVLAANGNEVEAVSTLVALLEQEPGRSSARSQLLELDPDQGFAYLKTAAPLNPDDSSLWTELGDQYLQRNDSASAVDAWLTAFRNSPGDTMWANRLQEHAPEQLISEYEAATAGSTNDELWGDMADTYWRTGRFDDALFAWKKANEIDPGDSEWTSKIASVENNTDPFSW